MRNLNLKVAIVSSGRHSYEIAESAGIRGPTLSEIVGGRLDASPELRQRISGALGRGVEDLFPEEAAHA